jgi:SNF family Na+-dependent transporter
MTLLDNYGVGTAVFFYGISQTVAIFWIYGLKRFCSDIKFMINQTVGIFWKVTWGFTAPVALIVIYFSKHFYLSFSFKNIKYYLNSKSGYIHLWKRKIARRF